MIRPIAPLITVGPGDTSVILTYAGRVVVTLHGPPRDQQVDPRGHGIWIFGTNGAIQKATVRADFSAQNLVTITVVGHVTITRAGQTSIFPVMSDDMEEREVWSR